MTIAAVLTTFNRRAFLQEALASVRAQTCPPDEIIIVDDGSTDGTREQMREVAGVHYHWQPNAGTSSARNAGWRLAQAEWIAFLDSDDLWEPAKLAEQKAAALQDEKVEAIFGHAFNFASTGTEQLFDADRHGLGQLRPAWLPGAALIRRSLLERAGGFDCSVAAAESIEWILRLRRLETRTVMLPGCVLHRRLHGGNKRLLSKQGHRENLALVQEWLQHKRARGAIG